MKKTSFARRCSRMSRRKKAQVVKTHSTGMKMLQVSLKDREEASRYSKCRSFHSDLLEIKQMSEKNVKELRSKGFMIKVLEPTTGKGSQYAHMLKVVKGLAGIGSVGKKSLFECMARQPRVSRVRFNISRSPAGRGGGGSLRGFGGGCCPSPGGGGGGNDSNNNDEERMLLVAILTGDGKTRKRLYEELETLDKREEAIRKRLNQLKHEDERNVNIHEPQPKKIFHERIDEDKMAQALFEVYDQMLGNSAKRKNAHYDLDPIDLVAYLFIMVVLCHYGRYEFDKNGRKPFFDFFIDKVAPELYGKRGMTSRSLHNHVNDLSEWLYLTNDEKLKNPKPVQSSNKGLEKMYDKVCGIFHDSSYGSKLKNQVWE